MDSHTKHRRQKNSAFRENKNVSKQKCMSYYICKPAVKKKKTCIIEKVPYLNSIKRLSLTNLSLSISAPFSIYIYLMFCRVTLFTLKLTHMTKYPVVQLRWISTIARKR